MNIFSRYSILLAVVALTSVVLAGCSLGKKAPQAEPADSMIKQETSTVPAPSADPAADEAAMQAVKSGKTGEAAAAATTNLDATFSGLDNRINENDLDEAALGM